MDITQLYQLYLQSANITTDTRTISQGDIFFALKGANFNGNKFAGKALEQGAAYAVIDEEEYNTHKNCILVDDVLKCLQQLATHHRRQFNIPFVAITGTNGKTTTKELVNVVLSQKYKVHATKGNFNNHIGVPLTLLAMPRDTEIAIIEMGANHIGEINELCEIAEPDYGIITNVGKAHLEGFGSFQGVIETKTELYRWVAQHGKQLFVNYTNDILKEKAPAAICQYYQNQQQQPSSFTDTDSGIIIQWNNINIQTHLFGVYNYENVLAALSIGEYFKLSPQQMAEGIQQYQPTNNRSQIKQTQKNRLILDAYNANPSSMTLAVQNFIAAKNNQSIVILGDMLELGQYSFEEHQSILNLLADNNQQAILVGPEFYQFHKQYPYRFFKTVHEALQQAKLNELNNYHILIKGSRGIQLEKLQEVL